MKKTLFLFSIILGIFALMLFMPIDVYATTNFITITGYSVGSNIENIDVTVSGSVTFPSYPDEINNVPYQIYADDNGSFNWDFDPLTGTFEAGKTYWLLLALKGDYSSLKPEDFNLNIGFDKLTLEDDDFVLALIKLKTLEEHYPHSFDENLSYDNEYHWQQCICSAVKPDSKSKHTFDENDDCTTCSYEKEKLRLNLSGYSVGSNIENIDVTVSGPATFPSYPDEINSVPYQIYADDNGSFNWDFDPLTGTFEAGKTYWLLLALKGDYSDITNKKLSFNVGYNKSEFLDDDFVLLCLRLEQLTEEYKYNFINGENQSFIEKKVDKYSLKIDGDYSKFKNITVESLTLENTIDYIVTEGSTIINFTDSGIAKLNKLTAGNYKIAINYTNGKKAETKLTILEPKYNVIFDANEGIFSGDKTSIIIQEWDDSKLASVESPTRDGYKFLGFFSKKTGGTKIETYIAKAGIDKEGLIFYAQWEKEKVTPEDNTINNGTVEPEDNTNKNETKPENNISNPQTGDNIMLFVVMLVASILGIIFTLKVRKDRIK